MKAELGLENGQGSYKDSGSISFVFVQKSYTQNFTLPTNKNNIYIYNIYISLMLRKSVSCAKVLVSLHPVGAPGGAGGLSAACRPCPEQWRPWDQASIWTCPCSPP